VQCYNCERYAHWDRQDSEVHRSAERPATGGAGAAFDFLASTKSQAPVWMQQSGLEWTYRLAHEPHHHGNDIFISSSSRFFVVALAQITVRPVADIVRLQFKETNSVNDQVNERFITNFPYH
jgi:glycosyl transferase family WecB/TagA/CpsF